MKSIERILAGNGQMFLELLNIFGSPVGHTADHLAPLLSSGSQNITKKVTNQATKYSYSTLLMFGMNIPA